MPSEASNPALTRPEASQGLENTVVKFRAVIRLKAVPVTEEPRMIDFAQSRQIRESRPTHHTDLERLGDEIAELAAHIHAATYRLLVLIREFDQREGGDASC